MSTRGNPITPQAPVVVNGWFDRHFATWRTRNQSNPKCAGNPFDDVSQENFSVLPRELAFKLLPQYDKWIQRPASAHNSDNGPRIFTSLNGFPFFESGMKVDKARARARANTIAHLRPRAPAASGGGTGAQDPKDLRDSVVFVGLPLIAVDAKNPNQKDSISLMVAGSTTITNTGPQRISAGDLVVWDVPTKSRTSSAPSAVPAGVSRSKALFWTLPLNARDDNVLRGEKSNIMEARARTERLARAFRRAHCFTLRASAQVVRSAMNLPAVKSALTDNARGPKRARTDPNDDVRARRARPRPHAAPNDAPQARRSTPPWATRWSECWLLLKSRATTKAS